MSKQEGKVFIGGLSWETTDEKLRCYFENFGVVQEAFVSYDRHTGRPRGFGFVVFADSAVADRVVSQPHTIDRREVEAKKALPKEDSPGNRDGGNGGPPGSGSPPRTKKVFVGGLAASVDEASFRTFFSRYGTVEDAVVMYDFENRRPRGFGFVTFADEEAVDRLLAAGSVQTMHDKTVEVKRAVPRDAMALSPRLAQPRSSPATAAAGGGAASQEPPRPPPDRSGQHGLANARAYAAAAAAAAAGAGGKMPYTGPTLPAGPSPFAAPPSPLLSRLVMPSTPLPTTPGYAQQPAGLGASGSFHTPEQTLLHHHLLMLSARQDSADARSLSPASYLNRMQAGSPSGSPVPLSLDQVFQSPEDARKLANLQARVASLSERMTSASLLGHGIATLGDPSPSPGLPNSSTIWS